MNTMNPFAKSADRELGATTNAFELRRRAAGQAAQGDLVTAAYALMNG